MIWCEFIKENSQNIGLYYQATLKLGHVYNTTASAYLFTLILFCTGYCVDQLYDNYLKG